MISQLFDKDFSDFPLYTPKENVFDTTSLLREVANTFFEAEEETREASNDALREAAKKAMQDPKRLHEWILRDWEYATLANRVAVIL